MATDPGFAPAKINLTLHVTGQRPDGYHLLDSLVVFVDIGDRVSARPAPELSLAIDGPEAGALAAAGAGGGDNLVLRAARSLGLDAAALTLWKALPVSAGIGGGSSDAAAALRVLTAMTGRAMPTPAAASALGADVPVCLTPRPTRLRGIGEELAAVPPLPRFHLVLVNPRIAVPTPDVFRRLASRSNPPMPASLPAWPELRDLIGFLAACRNDMQDAAISIAPGIRLVLDALGRTSGCVLVRMSGSGATCFGMFRTAEDAAAAAAEIRARHPGWWVAAARLLESVS